MSTFEFYAEPECNGICLTGWDIGVPCGGIAYPHPECALHNPEYHRPVTEWNRDAQARENEILLEGHSA